MNCNVQNKKIEAITETTLVIGIDVGSETHYARAFDDRGLEYSKKPFKFSNNEAGFASFKAWILEYKEAHGKDKVVPGMEPTGHYWFNLGKFLQDNEMKPVLVNPHIILDTGRYHVISMVKIYAKVLRKIRYYSEKTYVAIM